MPVYMTEIGASKIQRYKISNAENILKLAEALQGKAKTMPLQNGGTRYLCSDGIIYDIIPPKEKTVYTATVQPLPKMKDVISLSRKGKVLSKWPQKMFDELRSLGAKPINTRTHIGILVPKENVNIAIQKLQEFGVQV